MKNKKISRLAMVLLVAASITKDGRAAAFSAPVVGNNVGAFTLHLREVTTAEDTVAFYQDRNGQLRPITGQMIPLVNGGGVLYDLDQIVPNLNLTAGDLVLNDPGTPTVRSDILRFGLLPGENRVHTVRFLSDQEQPGERPFRHDVQPPAPNINDIVLLPNNIATNELAAAGSKLEEIDGILYKPERECCDPGFDPNGFVQNYNILSDIPEPTSMLLMGSGLVGLFGCGWRRRRKST